MDANRRHTERLRSQREALAVIGSVLEPLLKAGSFGEIRLALFVQDGHVVRLQDRGFKRTHTIATRKAA